MCDGHVVARVSSVEYMVITKYWIMLILFDLTSSEELISLAYWWKLASSKCFSSPQHYFSSEIIK